MDSISNRSFSVNSDGRSEARIAHGWDWSERKLPCVDWSFPYR
jgi:hypothetical protein